MKQMCQQMVGQETPSPAYSRGGSRKEMGLLLLKPQFLPREGWSKGGADGNMLAKQKSSGPPYCCYLTAWLMAASDASPAVPQ